MKKILLPIIFTLFVYSTMYYFIINIESVQTIICLLATIVFGIINIVMAIIQTIKKDKKALLIIGTSLKSLMIGAYVSIFIIAAGIATLLTVFIGPFSLLTTIPAILFDLFVLVVTSSYIVGYLIVDFKDNKKTTNIIHVILQFIFVLDVLDMLFICFFKEKKNRLLSIILIIISIIIPYIIYRFII